MIDKRAATSWDKASIRFDNYQKYLNIKKDKFDLHLIDLLYISNFKGGNSTINEPVEAVEKKLRNYTSILMQVERKFGTKALKDLSTDEVKELILQVDNICKLSLKNSEAKIDGFGTSYLSALLNSLFISLIPILDRRVLINSGIVEENDLNSQKQVKQIIQFYPALIKRIYEEAKKTNKTLRQLDREFFVKKI